MLDIPVKTLAGQDSWLGAVAIEASLPAGYFWPAPSIARCAGGRPL